MQVKLSVGQRFDKLTIEERVGSRHGRALWRFRCDCGKSVERISDFLARHDRHSCGCLRGYWMKGVPFALTHGLTDTKLYAVWQEMKQRCNNPKNPAYKNYGGRGITICPEWQTDFVAFFTWAERNGYAPGLDVDRVDNDEGYSPANCRFVTRAVNMANRRCSKRTVGQREDWQPLPDPPTA